MAKKKVISLLEFLQTGKFGALQIGSTEAEMLEFLGQPTAWADTTPNENKFCHYADVQFFFFKAQLYLIHIDWFSGSNNAPLLNEPHYLEPWLIREHTSLEEIQNALHTESLFFQMESKHGSIILKLESNTKIYFDEETKLLTAISTITR
jgi:hypothetical protein